MSAVLHKAFADASHRRLQAFVILVVVALSSLAGALALSLLVETDKPFDHAFEQVSGSHLTVLFDPARATQAQVAATASLSSVSSSAGPFLEVQGAVDNPKRGNQPFVVQGRDRPGGPVDRLTLQRGTWVTGPGQVVLSNSLAVELDLAVGDTLTPPAESALPPLRVVGVAIGVADPVDAWISEAQARSGVAGGYRMYYRLRSASSPADLTAASRSIAGALPSRSVLESSNWLDVKRNADLVTAVMIPFLLAFSGFALAAAALIIANVVAGAVIAGYRDIGVLKSVGFTPAQVVGVYVIQMLLPAVIGCALGIPAGVVLSQPFLAKTAAAFQLPQTFAFSPLVSGMMALGVLLVVLAAALVPALRAGRLSAVQAISSGSAPQGRGAFRLGRVLARLPLPRAYSLGGAESFAKPVRSMMTMIAITIAVATVAFAGGLVGSLRMVAGHLIRDQYAPVVVSTPGGPDLTPTLLSVSGTAGVVAEKKLQVSVAGLGQPAQLTLERGDSSRLGWAVIEGRWYSGPGEAVVTRELLREARASVGDVLTVIIQGHDVRLRVVGAYLDQSASDNMHAGWATLVGAGLTLTPDTYEVSLRPGVSPDGYAQSVAQAMDTGQGQDAGKGGHREFGIGVRQDSSTNESFLLIDSVLVGLALILTAIGLAGVFNTVMLSTREKARDIGILKAFGMTPWQTVAMVLSSVAVLGLLGGVFGLPLGELLHHQILASMADIAARTDLPSSFYSVFSAAWLALLVLAGLGVALLGALVPARWAARGRVAAVLHAE